MNFSSSAVLRHFKIKPISKFTVAGALFCGLLTPALGQNTFKKDLESPAVKSAVENVNIEALKAHMTYLSDDLLEGRKAGSRGFDLAARYMASQFQQLGLKPGINGTAYLQEVPLRKGVVDETASTMKISRKGKEQSLVFGTDFIVSPNLVKNQTQVSAQVVFVGYGISAPELNYDDYAKINVKGKVVMYLSGGPTTFPNNERAYFTSELGKHAAAAANGAVGVISVVPATENQTAWRATVARTRGGVNRWVGKDGLPNSYFSNIQGVASVYQDVAQTFFEGSKTNLESALATLKSGKTASVILPVTAQIATATKFTDYKSSNIVGILPGSDPVLKNEYVVYAAHVDHLGITKAIDGDSINNGAHDNASGSAILLETIRAYKSLPVAPKRSVIFVSCTGEELGLLGSDYFASNPPVPQSSLVANLALDMPFFFYPMQDIIPHGIQHSNLRGPVEAATAYLGLKITPDPAPEEVVFTRSDHYSFIKKGIPALFIKGGVITGDPNKDGAKIIADWRKNIYHKIKDDMNQPFDWTAAAMHVKTNFLIGYLAANATERPAWNKGDFFGGKFGKPVK